VALVRVGGAHASPRAALPEPNGEFVDHLDDRTRRLQAYVLARDDWERLRRDDIELAGVDACRELLGA